MEGACRSRPACQRPLTFALHRAWTRAALAARAIIHSVRVHAVSAEPLDGGTTDRTMPDTAELTRILHAQSRPDCAALTPFTIESADFECGRVVLRFGSQPAFKNHFDSVQGGFAVAMADVLISLAAFAKTKAWLPTVEIKSSFLAPLKLGECRGEGSVIKAGKQLVFLEARLWGADGKLAVHVTATAAVPPASEPSVRTER